MSCRCSCIPTPQSILDDEERDVFDEIIPEGSTFRDIFIEALWSVYRYRGIGSCDIDYWIQTMIDRYNIIVPVYFPKFKALDEWLTQVSSEDPTDMSDGKTEYNMITEIEDNPDNPQGDTKYLSDRNTVTYNGKTFSGLSSETVSRFMDYVPNLLQQFADEFRKQFYWGL